MEILVKTIRWQCSGCDHLCAMLLDSMVEPVNLVHLAMCKPNQKWQRIDKLRILTEGKE